MVDALEIGYAIKQRRAELGLTQAQLAERSGVSKRCLWSMELGQSSGVQLDKLTAVLTALELELTLGPVDKNREDAAKRTSDIPADLDELFRPQEGALEALRILTGGKHGE